MCRLPKVIEIHSIKILIFLSHSVRCAVDCVEEEKICFYFRFVYTGLYRIENRIERKNNKQQKSLCLIT